MSEIPYVPSSELISYNYEDFDTTIQYARQILLRTIPFYFVGIVAFLVLLFWSCGRCCGICIPSCCRARPQQTVNWKIAAVIICIGAIVGLGIALSDGFKADSNQGSVLTSIPIVVDDVVLWSNLVAFYASNVSFAALAEVNTLDTITSQDPSGIYTSPTTVATERSLALTIQSVTSNISSIAQSFSLHQLTSFTNRISSYNSQRHTAMLAILFGLLFIVLLQVGIILMESFLPEKRRPSRSILYKILGPLLTIKCTVLVLLLWILSGLLFSAAVVTADFCVNADFNVLKTTHQLSSSTAQYLVYCDEPLNTYPSPFEADILSLTAALETSITGSSALKSHLPLCGSNAACLAVTSLVNALNQQVSDLVYDAGYTASGVPAWTYGLLSTLTCQSFNGNYQAALNVGCGDMFPAVAKSFQFFLSVAIILTVLEATRRFIETRKSDAPAAVSPAPVVFTSRRESSVSPHPMSIPVFQPGSPQFINGQFPLSGESRF